MKLRPRSCEHAITAMMGTLGSLIADTRPLQALETIDPSLRSIKSWEAEHTSRRQSPRLLHPHLQKAVLVRGDAQRVKASEYCSAIMDAGEQ